MLQIQTTNLPAEQQRRLHPGFLVNERHYLRMRPQLLEQYQDQWVAIHDGRVIAHSGNPLTVMEAVGRAGCHAFVALVGQEGSATFRVRRWRYYRHLDGRCSTKPSALTTLSGNTLLSSTLRPR